MKIFLAFIIILELNCVVATSYTHVPCNSTICSTGCCYYGYSQSGNPTCISQQACDLDYETENDDFGGFGILIGTVLGVIGFCIFTGLIVALIVCIVKKCTRRQQIVYPPGWNSGGVIEHNGVMVPIQHSKRVNNYVNNNSQNQIVNEYDSQIYFNEHRDQRGKQYDQKD